MAHLPILKPAELIRIIQKQGFRKDRQSGSHVIFAHPDGRWTSIPIHRTRFKTRLPGSSALSLRIEKLVLRPYGELYEVS